jgi:hypothetical protein
VSYLVFAFGHGGWESVVKIGMFLIFPLACIWFADAMGGYTGPTPNMSITKTSPGAFVFILGWVLLLLPLVFLFM